MQKESVDISSDEDNSLDENNKTKNQRLVYSHAHGTVEIHRESLSCLAAETYLTDTIIQFYLAYLLNEECHKNLAPNIHIFDSIFYEQLDKIFEKKIDHIRLRQLSKWYDGIDIFERHFLIFPICCEDHWYAIIVCYPVYGRDIGYQDNIYTNGESLEGENRPPGIIVMDSLGLKKTFITCKVRDFLDYEWRTRLKRMKIFSYHKLKEYKPSLPKQTNAYDCGLFMLAYIKAFLEQPDDFYKLIRRNDRESQQSLHTKVNKHLQDTTREAIKSLIFKVCKI